VLKIREIDVYYGAIHALKNLSLEVAEGSIVTLIGANGAGKTTTLKSISGILRPSSGSILFKGQELLKMAPEKIVALGISQQVQNIRGYVS
jgi:branched-chain amino acid transport system ATP-binding protein